MSIEVKYTEFVVPGDITRWLSPNRHYHWAVKAKLVKEWREKAYLCWKAAGAVQFDRKVWIQFTIRKGSRGRPVDPDNAASSCKHLTDGLHWDPLRPDRPAMLPDDSSKWVAFAPIEIEYHKEYQDSPHVVVCVTQREEENG